MAIFRKICLRLLIFIPVALFFVFGLALPSIGAMGGVTITAFYVATVAYVIFFVVLYKKGYRPIKLFWLPAGFVLPSVLAIIITIASSNQYFILLAAGVIFLYSFPFCVISIVIIAILRHQDKHRGYGAHKDELTEKPKEAASVNDANEVDSDNEA